MNIVPLGVAHVPALIDLMSTGRPFIAVRSPSDYWAYATLFSSTCPVVEADGRLVGAVLAFRSQDDPDDIYVQDAVVRPGFRGTGLASRMLDEVVRYGVEHGCHRLYATVEPGNTPVHRMCDSLGFVNVPGDRVEHGVCVIADVKGPGKDRAVYELVLR